MATCTLATKEEAELRQLYLAWDEAASALKDRLEDLLVNWQDEFDDRSDKWQAGKSGQAAQERLLYLNNHAAALSHCFESIDLDEIVAV